MIPTADDLAFRHTRSAVARLILEQAVDGAAGGAPPRLAQRDIAARTGSDWYTVHLSLKSIRDAGAIRIERNRIIVNKDSLRRLAAEAA